jgi:internalin A
VSVQKVTVENTIRVCLPALQTDFDELKNLLIKAEADPNLKRNLQELGDSLDAVSSTTEEEKLKKPMNKLGRFLDKFRDRDSSVYKIASGTEKGLDLVHKLADAYNKLAPLLGLAPVLLSSLGVS